MVLFDEDDFIAHYGVKRRSGRYPYGSGGDDTSELGEAKYFQSALNEMRNLTGPDKMTESQIAKSFGMTTNELRANITAAGNQVKQDRVNRVRSMSDAGMSNMGIHRETGIPEPSVRALLKPDADFRANRLTDLADTIKASVDKHGYVDVSKGNAQALGVKKTMFDTAVAMLTNDGYAAATILQPQLTAGHDTRVRVLAKPGNDWKSINANKHLIQPLQAFSNDGGKTFGIAQEPLKLNPKRLDVVYGPEGGEHRDGLIYVRPGVKDLDMGAASYAQVRIAVGNGHFIKGMAVKKEGLPEGVDVQFHTNKARKANKLDALKPIVEGGDPIERFGSVFRQIHDPKTGKVKSLLNIVNNDDDWEDWSRSLASQMLSKQKPDFVKKQLDVTFAKKKAELDDILSLTNPVIKKKLLESYADDMDSSAVHLKAAALPRQKTHVILPVKSLKDNEVYAPGYNDGERLALVRYPHGGKFEIPELVVNNRNQEARSIMPPKETRAAIGINAKVARQLSGADFDGDTVVVIPNNHGRIVSERPLKELQGFDPQSHYRGTDPNTGHMLPGIKKMTNTQTEMGKISNLINDMSIGGAPNAEIARAVKHSMVVIDAEKHGLDHKRSYEENGIKALKAKYQPGINTGASTIISRSGGKVQIAKLKERSQADGGPIDKRTGEKVFVPHTKNVPVKDPKTGKITWEKQLSTTNRRVVDKKTGEITWVPTPATERVARGTRKPGVMVNGVQVKEGKDLTSNGELSPPVERHYAAYSDKVRSLANDARLALLRTPDPSVSPSAKKVYAAEVSSLKSKLVLAQSNSPRERHAQRAADVIFKMKKAANPAMSDEQLKRARSNALRTTRDRLDAKPVKVEITAKEWEAIQNNAVSSSVLKEILTKADMTKVRELATPKSDLKIQPSGQARAKALLNAGYTRAEVAADLGVSVSTLDRSLK